MRARARSCLIILILASPASARACPVAYDTDAMEAAIRAAPGCRAAADVARACSLGTGADVALAGAVSDVCERDFLAGLDQSGRSAYARQRATCLAKYRTDVGSMYRSAEAFCQAGVSERFSRRAFGAKPGR